MEKIKQYTEATENKKNIFIGKDENNIVSHHTRNYFIMIMWLFKTFENKELTSFQLYNLNKFLDWYTDIETFWKIHEKQEVILKKANKIAEKEWTDPYNISQKIKQETAEQLLNIFKKINY